MLTHKDGAKVTRAQGVYVALSLKFLLGKYCDLFEIAGSIRRNREMVSDVEIVVVPRLRHEVVDLFGNTQPINDFDVVCAEFRRSGDLQLRLDRNYRAAWGERYKRVRYDGVAVDLFSVLPPAQLGVIMALRTGPWLFSQRIVTQRRKGGFLPDEMFVKDGQLFQRTASGIPALIETPTEEDFFGAIGMPWIEPEQREAA